MNTEAPRTRYTVQAFHPRTGGLVQFHTDRLKVAQAHSDRLQEQGYDSVNLIDRTLDCHLGG